ncbi:MAG TPA: YciI family protein [Bacteroidota bacterium]|nr:YciI family protein [Bacteroidota bacterium]
MSEFMLLFRNDVKAWSHQTSPDQVQAAAKQWQDWIGGIVAQNKFVSSGNRLSVDGKVVRPNNVVTDGPYAEIKESLAGYMIIKANGYDEALALAKGCPILASGGNVEVRKFVAANENA